MRKERNDSYSNNHKQTYSYNPNNILIRIFAHIGNKRITESFIFCFFEKL